MNIRDSEIKIKVQNKEELELFINQFDRKGVFFGAIVLSEYLKQTDSSNVVIKKDAIVISRNESKFPYIDIWQKDQYENLKDFVLEVGTELPPGDILDYVDYYNVDFSIANGFEKQYLNRIIDLNIMRIIYDNGYFKMFEETKQDIDNKIMKIGGRIEKSYKQWQRIIENVLFFEKNYSFSLSVDANIWTSIVNKMAQEELFLENLIQWNTMVKHYQSNQVPIFLLSIKNSKKRKMLSDLQVIIRFRDSKHLWRIFWNELSVLEKLHPLFLFSRDNSEILKFSENKEININDFFIVVQDELKVEEIHKIDLPKNCLEIINFDENTNIEDYLQRKKAKGSLVLLKQISKNKYIAGCTTKKNLSKQNLYFYQCTISEEQFTNPERYALKDETFIRIDVFEFPIFISETNLNTILENKTNEYFIVNETPLLLNFTIEKVAADKHTGAQISGHHCQQGSEKQISIVFPVNIKDLQNIKF